MVNKLITSVDTISTLDTNDSFFVNSGLTLKQIPKKNVLDSIDGISITKVWENAKPTDTFAVQNISIGTVSTNDFVMIKVKYSPTVATTISILYKIGSIGEIVRLSSSWTSTFSSREFNTTTTEVQFKVGKVAVFNGSVSTDNNVVIPTEIYIIKGVN